jgi:glyoxylase-like metal-dependent hydrolase (beta-lactamase superfamily II)
MSFEPLPELPEAWREENPAERLRRLRKACAAARDAFVDEGPVLALRTCPIATFPYPTGYAFQGAASSPAPYVMMTNRMMVVQYEDRQGEKRTLLFNPSDDERADKAPFYAKLKERFGTLSEKLLAKRHGHVPEHLAKLGIAPDDVDYIAYDHLHLQDLRGWLGGYNEAGLFGKAKLLVMREEWLQIGDPHPIEVPWYVPGGSDGVPEDRVVFLEGDTWLGRGLGILRTPGHTPGNMSLAFHIDSGVYVCSENGVSAESYTPESSEIRGLSSYAERLDQEVILNGNTRDNTLDQFNSMIVEKNFAGRNADNPGFVNFYPSSELTRSVASPGLAPTFSHGELTHGELERSAGG